MENITHSLIGATLAELALPARASVASRRLFFAAGIVAANLPDADLLYTRITPPPLGYLLHHRGHTHTIVGCALLGVLIWVIATLIPPARRRIAETPRRFWWLVAIALASHLVLDAWNSYGVHPFWPVDNRWYYGDAIFILEPVLWMLLGTAVALNTETSRRRFIGFAALIALPLAVVRFGMIPVGSLAMLIVIGGAFVWSAWRAPRRVRSVAALGVTALFVAVMFGLSHLARGVSLASLHAAQQGEIVDVVLNPNPAAPLCWSALAVERNDASNEYALRRGTLALFDGWLPARVCNAISRADDLHGRSRSSVEWSIPIRQPLARLRELSRDDCWVRAWLQFGRAPLMGDDNIVDFRFGGRGTGGNFTAMQLLPAADARICPPHLTNWGMPRADLLQ